MRTTVDIPDATYRLLKSKAAAEGRTVKELLLRGAEVVLRQEKLGSSRKIPRLSKPPIMGGTPGCVPALANAELYDLIDFP